MRLKRALMLCLLLVLLFVAYAGWRAWQVRSDLEAAATSAHRLQAALSGGDQATADQELETLRERTASAADHTGGPMWSLLAAAPVLGDDAAAVRTTSNVLYTLSRDGLNPLVRTSAELHAGAFAPHDGSVPVESISALAQPVGDGLDAFTAADGRLAAVDTKGLIGPVRRRFEDFAQVVHDGSKTLATANKAVRLLPSMLGTEGNRRYLLIFQNNAEARATGGMPGAMSVLNAHQGRIQMTRQATASDFPELDEPILPLTVEERAVFGAQLGVFFQDANFTPHFPRTAELWAARWQQQFGDHLDGVLSVDPVATSYLLGATGPLTVDGVHLTANNVVDQLLNHTYLRLADPAAQDAFFQDVAGRVFDAVSSGVGSPQALIEAFARGAAEGRVLVHSFDADEQGGLAGTEVAGELTPTATVRPQVGVFLNDATGSKMSYYLDYQTDVSSVSCTGGQQRLEGHFSITSKTPRKARLLPASIAGDARYGIPVGSQLVATDVYGPIGGALSDFALNGKKLKVKTEHYQGRPVVTLALFFDPGQRIDVTWRMTAGDGQTGNTDVRVTPGAQPKDVSSVASSVCSR